MSGAPLPPSPGRWFRRPPASGGRGEPKSPDPAGSRSGPSAGRQAEELARLIEQRRAEAEALGVSIGELSGEIMGLSRARARLAAQAVVAGRAGASPRSSAERFWSPVPVAGFRSWRLTRAGALGIRQAWGVPSLEAVCVRGPGAPHDAPCRCGIYALKRARALVPCLLRIAPWSIHGLVAMTGRVVEHDLGYRAQRAEVLAVAVVGIGVAVCRSDPGFISRLFTPGAGLSVAGASADGVDADPVEYLEDQARRFGEPWTSVSRSE